MFSYVSYVDSIKYNLKQIQNKVINKRSIMLFSRFILTPVLLVLPFLSLILSLSAAVSAESLHKQKQAVEHHLNQYLNHFHQLVEREDLTGLRLKVAAYPTIQALAVWDENHQLVFPDINLSMNPSGYSIVQDHRRLEELLSTAAPNAWEAYGSSEQELFYCRKMTFDLCLLLDTQELGKELGLPRDELLSAIFTESSTKQEPQINQEHRSGIHTAWYYALISLFIICAVLFTTPFVAGKFRKRQSSPNTSTSVVEEDQGVFTMGDMRVDSRRMLVTRDQLSADISLRDLKLLQCLVNRPDEVLTKDELYNAGWGRDFVPSSRALEQHIMTLRKKIDPERQRIPLIETVHGQGYRFPTTQL